VEPSGRKPGREMEAHSNWGTHPGGRRKPNGDRCATLKEQGLSKKREKKERTPHAPAGEELRQTGTWLNAHTVNSCLFAQRTGSPGRTSSWKKKENLLSGERRDWKCRCTKKKRFVLSRRRGGILGGKMHKKREGRKRRM